VGYAPNSDPPQKAWSQPSISRQELHAWNRELTSGHALPQVALYTCRYHDISCRRWLNGDAIGLEGGPNLYGYGGASHIEEAVPLGLDAVVL
jgi:hypothetical protein